jgi:hypothetical protein
MLYVASSGGRIHVFVALIGKVCVNGDGTIAVLIPRIYIYNCKLLFWPSANRNTKDKNNIYILVRGSDSVGAFYLFIYFYYYFIITGKKEILPYKSISNGVAKMRKIAIFSYFGFFFFFLLQQNNLGLSIIP